MTSRFILKQFDLDSMRAWVRVSNLMLLSSLGEREGADFQVHPNFNKCLSITW